MSVIANIALIVALLAGTTLGYFAGAVYGTVSLLCFLFFPRLTLLIMKSIPFTGGLLSDKGTPNSILSMLIFYGILYALTAVLQALVFQLDKRLRPLLSRSARRYFYDPLGAAALAFAFFLLFSLLFSTFAGLMPQESQVLGSLAAKSSAKGMELMALPDFREVSWEEFIPGKPLIPPEPESRYSIELPQASSSYYLQPDLEKEMVKLVNAERVKRGLKPLFVDPILTRMARDHSLDMCKRRYFSHYSPEGDDVADRAKRAGLYYKVVGENLALAPDLMSAHEGLMESPGHRQNILSPEYSRIGIGIYRDTTLGLFVTQNFAD